MTTTVPTVSIDLPVPIYRRFEALAASKQASVSEVLEEIALRQTEEIREMPKATQELLAYMETLSDEELQPYLDARLTPAQEARGNELRTTWNQRALTKNEQTESELLSDEASRKMLIRTKAIAILVSRGYNLAEFLNDPQIS